MAKYKYDAALEARIDEILGRMSLSDKIAQLNMVDAHAGGPEYVDSLVREGKTGAFIGTMWSREDFNRVQKIAVEESPMKIPMITGVDVIHGHKTCFPTPIAMAAAFNPELVRQSYRCIAEAARADCIFWTFTPMLDMCHDPRWGRVTEGPGEDPYVGAKLAAAIVEGLQGDDLSKPDSMAACAKHYVGYGGAEAGVDYHKAEISDQTLRNYYLPAFRSAVEAGCSTVMNAFNDVSGKPAANNRYLLTDVLRGEWGFDGFVVSDDHAVGQLERAGVAEDRADCAAQALNAGLDMDMRDNTYADELENCVKNGTVSVETIDEAVRRILRIKLRLGLFENPYVEERNIDFEAHSKVAKAIADETVVLLKNNGILPLDKKATIGLFGALQRNKELNAGCWAGNVDYGRVTDFGDAMKKTADPEAKVYVDAETSMGYFAMYPNVFDVAVLALGQTPFFDGENANVTSLELDDEQKVLIEKVRKMGKPVVAVIRAGRPLALESIEPYFDAILWCWHGGTEGSVSIADVIYGNVNPSGRLPITIPRVTGQEPIYYNQTTSCRNNEGYYGNNTIKNYRDCKDTPMYPFGYGLSYTTFEYSPVRVKNAEISLEDIKNGAAFEITVDVKNTGDVEGKEVVQCYTHDCVAKLTRPIREMKGYDKQNYKAGETKTVTFSLGYNELGYFDDNKTYVVEKGAFKVWVGPVCTTDNEITIKIV